MTDFNLAEDSVVVEREIFYEVVFRALRPSLIRYKQSILHITCHGIILMVYEANAVSLLWLPKNRCL